MMALEPGMSFKTWLAVCGLYMASTVSIASGISYAAILAQSDNPASTLTHSITDDTPVSLKLFIGGCGASGALLWWLRGEKEKIIKAAASVEESRLNTLRQMVAKLRAELRKRGVEYDSDEDVFATADTAKDNKAGHKK